MTRSVVPAGTTVGACSRSRSSTGPAARNPSAMASAMVRVFPERDPTMTTLFMLLHLLRLRGSPSPRRVGRAGGTDREGPCVPAGSGDDQRLSRRPRQEPGTGFLEDHDVL